MLCTHKTTILCQFGVFCHQLTTISPSILNHFWWELYHCGGIILISRPTFMDIYPYFQDNTSFKFPSSTHTHTHTKHTHTHTLNTHTYTYTYTHTQKLYISTYFYACQHKNMLHLPQEGSDRNLPYGTLLDVLW